MPEEWRDTVVRVEGPVVLQMQRLFLENWLYTTGEVSRRRGPVPGPAPAGTVKAQAVGSSRTSQLSLAKLHYYMPIQAARRCVWIENAYFLPDQDFRTALAPPPGGAWTCASWSRESTPTSRRCVMPDAAIIANCWRRACAFTNSSPPCCTAKVMMVDDLWCSIGSINFTARSMKSNAEANVAIYDHGFAEQVRAYIEADMARSEEITLEQWKQRGLVHPVQGECYFGLFTGLF